MIETIKKYITDKAQIKLAEEIILQFEKEKKKAKAPNLKLNKLEVSNFGNLKKFSMDFNKNVTFFEGPRNSGKSWAMESWLYLFSGGSRDVKGVIGQFDNKMSGKLYFNDLVSSWSRSESAGKLNIKQGEYTVCSNIRDVKDIMMGHTGLNTQLLTSMMYYSPRMSFQFSRKMPFEIEELLIKIAKLDIWLDLEAFTKKIKKTEGDKLSEIQGAIGYISEISYTKEELQGLVKKAKQEIKDIDQQISELKIPDVTKLNKEFVDIKSKVDVRQVLLNSIEECNQYKSDLKSKTQELEDKKKESESLGFDPKSIKNIENEIEKLNDKFNDIKTKGMAIKQEIEQKKDMTKNSQCPILQFDCDKLNKNNVLIEGQIVELTTKRNDCLMPKTKIDKSNLK
jgi:DNA repair exonuclease SbcCD ATPase subunit